MSTTLYMYHKVLFRVISVMSIFPHSIAPLKVVDHILRKASECTIQLPLFQNFLSSSNFQTPFQIASECTIYCPCFQRFLIIFNLSKHRSKCTRMHLLVSKLSQQCQLWFIYQGLIGNEQTYCYLRTHIIFFLSYSIYSR